MSTGQIVIDPDWKLLAVHKECHEIDSCTVCLSCVEASLDPLWILGHRRKHSQEVTVAEGTLTDIVGLNSINENLKFGVNIRCSFPFDSVHFGVFVSRIILISKRTHLGRKGTVSERRTLLDDSIHKLFCFFDRVALA